MSKIPCPECPWSRTVTPGALGGSPPEVYVGQIVLPVWLPCHMSTKYAGKATDVNEVSECHGAAIMRANAREQFKVNAEAFCEKVSAINHPIAKKIVKDTVTILNLPENKELVFGTLAEFYAHHHQISIEHAEYVLKDETIKRLAEREISGLKLQARIHK